MTGGKNRFSTPKEINFSKEKDNLERDLDKRQRCLTLIPITYLKVWQTFEKIKE